MAKEKFDTNLKQLNVDVARSYDSGFTPALEWVKFFNPDADVSGCNALKELVNGVFVNLGGNKGEGDEDGESSSEGMVVSQIPDVGKPTENIIPMMNED
ncbi:hypothetical protein SESBI_30228 [Sesbania bispinosa]|nr:hypothetical protein SESBI_30228 [Sesbania bispinosa]